MINNITDDILNIKTGFICHQVNCYGVMGAGLALSIKKKYPKVFDEYKKLCSSNHPKNLLGMIQIVKVSDNLRIVNVFSQLNYGKSGLYTRYDQLESCLLRLNEIAKITNSNIYLPYKIGCGLAIS